MQSIFIASLLATAVSANFMAHPLMKRDLLAPRATDAPAPGGLSQECQSAVLDIYKTMPTPAPAIVKDISEHKQTDPCSFSAPASLSKEYASYSSEIVSWYGKNEDNIKSALKECPELSKYATAVPVCQTAVMGGDKKPEATATTAEKAGNTPGAKGDESKTGSDTAAAATSTPTGVKTNGAAREGAAVMAAAAVAGIVIAAL
ncbi:hypothetical protein F53441_4185 [Fusarium austroafricanum]|uniref:DUF7735 domain-containing protein n=1 Tax=Fusarium austroafricanum TaxID=2364996 RepID=A0A8H4NVP1_9HYPO|nr:hypothetical protein F53441_4185 [Fusarium austroafricanum]